MICIHVYTKQITTLLVGMDCWNPAFDVTPHELITAIITEHGAFKPCDLKKKLLEL